MGDRVLMIPNMLNSFLIAQCPTAALQTLSRIQCIQGTGYQCPSQAGPRSLPPPQPAASCSLLLGAGQITSQLSSLQITEIFIK